jgi:hypothetical protein
MSGNPSAISGARRVRLEITPITRAVPLPGRIRGLPVAQATPLEPTPLVSNFVRPSGWVRTDGVIGEPSQLELAELETQMRDIALSGGSYVLLGLNAQPAMELSSGVLTPVLPRSPVQVPRGDRSGLAEALLGGGIAGAGVHQLTQFPIARFNGIPLPIDARIRFANPGRWLSGALESRLFTISVEGTNKFFSWDAHAPVGNTPHDFFHVNQKGMFQVFGQSDHAALAGAALLQAKQMRYLKLGGRLFLVVGVIVDGIQLGVATKQSIEQGSGRPVAAQAIRAVGGWAAAWAGAKAGVALGGLAGVETGPGLVLTAIGGGIVGGVAGYFGADWIADWIYEN